MDGKLLQAVEPQDLYGNLLQREAEIELLQETFVEIGSELDLERVYQIVAERARALVQAKTLLITILDDNCETYSYRGAAGVKADEIVGEVMPLDCGICGWVWRNNKAWWRGVLDELGEGERNFLEKDAGSIILVPLQGKKHFLGGIAGINKRGGNEFDRRDLNMLTMFASIVAIAIENAMAVQKLEEARQESEGYQRQLQRVNRQLTESNRELEYLSLYDAVTGLPNRSLFRDRFAQHIALARSEAQGFAVLLFDLNNFKIINDTLGHECGDQILKGIARRFLLYLDGNGILSRLGGDEFALLLPAVDRMKSLRHASQLLQQLDEPFDIDHMMIAVSVSIGVSLYPEHGEDLSNLLRHADQAMFKAKSGKRGVSLYDPESDYSSTGMLTMTADLRKAMEQQEFRLYYQAKVKLQDGVINSVEALGRWQHPQRGFVPPDIFIHELEQAGMIDRYTHWVIETAIEQIGQWQRQQRDISIAVNLSTQTLMNPDFMLYLENLDILENAGGQLQFEITENLFLSNYDWLSETLSRIRQLGICFSIDDFGTGYSSLARLKKLPVSELKIDRSFIMDMNKRTDDDVIVRSTIELAHNLGLVVVAEGVETERTCQRLKELGCDIAQGYLISKPVPIEQFEAFMADRDN
ncbi:diguanylate cyclase/phosphodiesterase (GGDEF & EAL domains) with PAS/PAC sensor(s) [hydrothermal vent metagenome]|uniref:Diguanylate cyclase/phosphodiesterase (GGDEF & EAL domains) with PAS/PAC sensor(S) n=1 Tax=hydrothermal vent metagenome TaxID=652676 RepID=A0A3B1B6N6_9ZZZZ